MNLVPHVCPDCGSSLAAGQSALLCPVCALGESAPGERVGDYELLGELARGGMGVVYRARQAGLNRLVALKLLPGAPFGGEEFRARFRIEAEAAARLRHPGIVAVHEIGVHHGQPFFSMDLIEGGSLAERLKAGALPPHFAAQILAEVARAVHYAHGQGVIHRDLKPSNILLDAENRAWLTDFGLARLTGSAAHLTLSGQTLGTPHYLPPERLDAHTGAASPAEDVYGLGAVLYHALTGRPPFSADTPAVILAEVRASEPVPPRRLNASLPRDLETICLRCLEKSPARRYATAAEVADDIARHLAGEPIHARPASPLEVAWRWCRRRPALAATLAALAAVSVLAFVLTDRARRAESGAKARAESTSAQLRESNAQLEDSLDRIELDRAGDLFRAGDSAGALAPLVNVIRRNPAHPVAGPRLASALWHGDFALPLPPPLIVGGRVLMMRFLRDGRTLLVSTDKGTETWDAAAGRRLIEFERGDERLFAAVLSADESTLAEWDTAPGKHVRLLDVATGRLCAPPIRHDDWLHTVEFSPDSSRIVTAGADPAAEIRDARTGVLSGVPLDHPPALWGAVFSPDGETIATCSGTTVRLWESRAQQMRAESPRLDDSEAKVMRFSPDGRWLMVACLNGTIRLLSAIDAQFTGPAMRHDGRIRDAAFSADSRRLLTASQDRTARVWSVPGGEPLAAVLRHGDEVTTAAFSPDGARIVTTSLDNTARLWDAQTGRPLSQPLRHFEQVFPALFTPDGATLYTGGADGVVQRWDLRAGAGAGAGFTGKRAEFSGDGNRVIAAARRQFARDTAELRPLATAAEFPEEMRLARISRDGRRAAIITGRGAVVVMSLDETAGAKTIGRSITDVSFSPDGTKIATAGDDQTARVWDAATGAAMTPPLAHGAPVMSVRFSPDGRALLTATWSPRNVGTGLEAARVWDAATGQPFGVPMPHGDDLYAAEFSPDGALVATGSDDNTARVWDARTGTPVSPPLHHARSVAMVAFSPDSRRVATASWDGTARVWDAHTGAPRARALTHDDRVTDVQFSPDGRRIATASRDKTVRLWDAASGQPLTEPLRHNAPVEQVRFHPGGQRIVTSTAGASRIWEVPDFSTPPPAWLAQLAEALSLAELPPDPAAALALVAQYEQTRAAALAEPGDSAYARLARRLFAPAEKTLRPSIPRN